MRLWGNPSTRNRGGPRLQSAALDPTMQLPLPENKNKMPVTKGKNLFASWGSVEPLRMPSLGDMATNFSEGSRDLRRKLLTIFAVLNQDQSVMRGRAEIDRPQHCTWS